MNQPFLFFTGALVGAQSSMRRETGYPMTTPIDTTRANGTADVGLVDMEYHYPTPTVVLSVTNLVADLQGVA